MGHRTDLPDNDRRQLEEALARELYATFVHTGKKVLIKERIEWIERKYGRGTTERIKHYMMMMKNGEIV